MVDLFCFQTFVDLVAGVGFLLVFLPDDDGTRNGHPALWRQRHCPIFVAARFLFETTPQQKKKTKTKTKQLKRASFVCVFPFHLAVAAETTQSSRRLKVW